MRIARTEVTGAARTDWAIPHLIVERLAPVPAEALAVRIAFQASRHVFVAVGLPRILASPYTCADPGDKDGN